MTPIPHGGGIDSDNSRRGWQLRLLLSLEEEECTRTRLLVTEVVAGIITDIVNVIPQKVNTNTALFVPAPVVAVSRPLRLGVIQDAREMGRFLDVEGSHSAI